ncbi:MAG: serine/threonine protein kinase [Myxococcales bacterium]|nr:serine/threonine protein kinase [Myxococcales bacterium]
MVDGELDLTEPTPKTFDDESEAAPSGAAPTPLEGIGDHVAFGSPTKLPPPIPQRVRASGTMPPPIPQTSPIAVPMTTGPLDWTPPPTDDTSQAEKLGDAGFDVELSSEQPKFTNESIAVDLPKIDPRSLPPLPQPMTSFARGTSLVPLRTLPPRSPTSDSGLYSMRTLPPPNRPSTESGLLALTKYQPHPVVVEPPPAMPVSRTAPLRADRTFAIRRIAPRSSSTMWMIAGVVCAGMLVGSLVFLVRGSRSAAASNTETPAAVFPTQAPVAAVPVTSKAPVTAVSSAPASATSKAPVIAVAAVKPAAPAPIAQPVSSIETPKALVRVPIMSNPTGATVTLIDDGNARVIGITPLDLQVDVTHNYDIVLVLKGHPTTVRHFDPRSEHELAINLASGSTSAAPQVAQSAAAAPATRSAPTPTTITAVHTTATPAPAHTTTAPAPVHVATTTPAHTTAAPTHSIAAPTPAHTSPAPASTTRAATPTPPATHKVAAAPVTTPANKAGNGVLMISSKPPCQISIDGKLTKLVTPQTGLSMAPGTYRIALINPQSHINTLFEVRIAAGQSTKLIRDFTKKK